MAKHLSHFSQPKNLLKRLLDEPKLVSIIQNLEAPVLSRLINKIGLEDSGEIIALASTAQVEQIFDEDLWKNSRAGQEEKFDPERFGLWLEVMMEMGASFTAARLTDMEPELVTLALSQQIHVLDLDDLAARFSESDDDDIDADLVDKALESSLSHEFDQYLVVSRHERTWDAVLAVLIALEDEHHSFFTRLADRCLKITSELLEESDGLYELLNAEEESEADARGVRDERREREGYISPSNAAAFLALASQQSIDEMLKEHGPDYITKSYFANLQASTGSSKAGRKTSSDISDPDLGEKIMEFVELMKEAEVIEKPTPTLLTGSGGKFSVDGAQLVRALFQLLETGNPTLRDHRMQEMNYLANVLVAGCSLNRRRFRPAEAAEAALCTCNLGLEFLLLGTFGAEPVDWQSETMKRFAETFDAVKMFRIGWNILFHELGKNKKAKGKAAQGHSLPTLPDGAFIDSLTQVELAK